MAARYSLKAYDSGTAGWVQWTATDPTATPLAGATTPNYTGSLSAKHIVRVQSDETAVRDALSLAAGDIAINSRKITGLGTPAANTDAATKDYADAVVTESRVLDKLNDSTAAKDVGGGSITNVNLVDGRDVSVDGTKLDGIESGAQAVTEAHVLDKLNDSSASKDMGGGNITNVGTVDGVDVSGLVSGHVIEDEGTPVTQRSNINFTGSSVSVSDSGGKTVVSISGGAPTEADVLDVLNDSTATKDMGGGPVTNVKRLNLADQSSQPSSTDGTLWREANGSSYTHYLRHVHNESGSVDVPIGPSVNIRCVGSGTVNKGDVVIVTPSSAYDSGYHAPVVRRFAMDYGDDAIGAVQGEMIGIALMNMSSGAPGYVCFFGYMDGMDTNSWGPDGVMIFADMNNPGGITTSWQDAYASDVHNRSILCLGHVARTNSWAGFIMLAPKWVPKFYEYYRDCSDTNGDNYLFNNNVPFDLIVIDSWVRVRSNSGGSTAQVRDGSSSALSDSFDTGSNGLKRDTGSVNAQSQAVAQGGSIKLNRSQPFSVQLEVWVKCLRTAYRT